MNANSRCLCLIFSTLLASFASGALKWHYPSSWAELDSEATPRWVIAYPEKLAANLKPLMELRSQQGYTVKHLPGANAAAIRQVVSNLNLGHRKRDGLVVVGKRSSHPGAEGRYHRMVGIPSDSRLAMRGSDCTPLFPVGRIPADTIEKADLLIRRILAFEHSWSSRITNRNGILLIGNPASSKRVPAADMLVSTLTGQLLGMAHGSWKTSGAADVPGHPFACTPQVFPTKFRAELAQPYDVGGYFGHSHAYMLCRADGGVGTLEGHIRRSFRSRSWKTLSASDQRGLFVSCGCYCLQKDNAVGYQSVLAKGGPIAFIGATGESHAAIGYLASKGLVGLMTEHPPKTAGEWFVGIQKAIATGELNGPHFFAFDQFDGSKGTLSLLEQRKEHLEMWMLVGDPATRLF
ncbi:MAG: C25 family cysteine peptidase [Limisphaerales bacterium]